jgi:hypothetical protein
MGIEKTYVPYKKHTIIFNGLVGYIDVFGEGNIEFETAYLSS